MFIEKEKRNSLRSIKDDLEFVYTVKSLLAEMLEDLFFTIKNKHTNLVCLTDYNLVNMYDEDDLDLFKKLSEYLLDKHNFVLMFDRKDTTKTIMSFPTPLVFNPQDKDLTHEVIFSEAHERQLNVGGYYNSENVMDYKTKDYDLYKEYLDSADTHYDGCVFFFELLKDFIK